MLLLYGLHEFKKEKVGYRKDWCNHCESEVISEQFRGFFWGHVFFVPILPLGSHSYWRCYKCNKNPREKAEESMTILVLGLLAFLFFFIVSLFFPYTGKEALMNWGIRIVLLLVTASFVYLIKLKLVEPELEKEVQPFSDDDCLYCDGRIAHEEESGVCDRCGIIRY